MSNKETIIKKIKKGLKVAAVTTLLATSLTSCGPNFDISSQNFASQESVMETANLIGCDMSYMLKEYGNFVRMKHNNGEPIYVCFDDSYSEELKANATEALDYVFGIVGKINKNYHYKVVDKTEFWLKGNKTKIYCTFGENVSTYKQHTTVANAHMEMHSKWYNFATENPIYFYYELNVNKDKLKGRDKDAVVETFIHELMHGFGSGDVYTNENRRTTTKFYGNTFMNNIIDFKMLTPNDVGCLISLYTDGNYNTQELTRGLKKYEEKFYTNYASINKKKIGTEENFDYEEFVFENSIIIKHLDGTKNGYTYRVLVEDGKYEFEIYDYFKKEIIDYCDGEVFEHDGIVVLKDVELKHGMKPYDKLSSYEGGYVQNFALAKKDGKYILYNYCSDFSHIGDCYEYEKSLTQ